MIWCYSISRDAIQSISSEEIAARLATDYMQHAIYFEADLVTE